MSVAAIDYLTDEELEDLGEDGISIATYISDKRPRKKKTSCKPPPSPKSPYLTSTNLQPRKTALWRSFKGTGMMHSENPSPQSPRELWMAPLKSSLVLSQSIKPDYDGTQAKRSTSASTPEYLKEAFGMKKPKYSRSSSNGYIPGTPDYKEKEDMYDEIIELKKCLQAQKSENDVMKTKLRRLEEDNNKKEKQIEQLLDPTKGPEYTRSLVDRKNDTSAVVNGLKQKILKLEQQCKEKDSTLTKLQSDLRTTNIEEMKIAMETYYEEVQRLRILLATAESTEKSRAASKETLKQQKVLNSAVLKLTKNLKQLQEENKTLREEIDRITEGSSSGAKGCIDWTKQRLVKKIIELEKKIQDSGSPLLEREVDLVDRVRATRANAVSASADPEARGAVANTQGNDLPQECTRLRGMVKKLREERASLQESLTDKDAEIKRQSAEKAKAMKDLERSKAIELEKASQHYKDVVEQLTAKVRSLEIHLEKKRCVTEESSHQNTQEQRLRSPCGIDGGECQESPEKVIEKQELPSLLHGDHLHSDSEDKNRAARTIQRHWHHCKSRRENKAGGSETDICIIQSALRGHLTRLKTLKSQNLSEGNLSNFHSKSPQKTLSCAAQTRLVGNGDQDDSVTLLQSVFRGHLARCRLTTNSFATGTEARSSGTRRESSAPGPAPRGIFSANCKSASDDVKVKTRSDDDEIEEDIPDVSGNVLDANLQYSFFRRKACPAQLDFHQPTAAETAKREDSDDSDDIIVSPSRPFRQREPFF